MLDLGSTPSTNLLFRNVLCGFWTLQKGQKPRGFLHPPEDRRGLGRVLFSAGHFSLNLRTWAPQSLALNRLISLGGVNSPVQIPFARASHT
jgi:hypothetical protein